MTSDKLATENIIVQAGVRLRIVRTWEQILAYGPSVPCKHRVLVSLICLSLSRSMVALSESFHALCPTQVLRIERISTNNCFCSSRLSESSLDSVPLASGVLVIAVRSVVVVVLSLSQLALLVREIKSFAH
jgi:hypothetical protein